MTRKEAIKEAMKYAIEDAIFKGEATKNTTAWYTGSEWLDETELCVHVRIGSLTKHWGIDVEDGTLYNLNEEDSI